MLDHGQLKAILPQAYPFLLLDRVEHVHPGESLVAIKNITANEWPFTNMDMGTAPLGAVPVSTHYPETLLIEAAAQAALVLYKVGKSTDAKLAFIGKVKAEFFSPVYVGDQVNVHVKSTRSFGPGGYSDVEILVAEDKRAEITAFFSIK